MKNYIKVILVILIFVICAVIIIPFYYFNDIVKAITMSRDLIGITASIVTIVIAILLFDRFGVQKKVMDKKVGTVINLLELLRSKTFYAEYKSDSFIEYHSISVGQNLKQYRKNALMLKTEILFNYEDLNEGLQDIYQFVNNVWLPKEISEKIQKLSLRSSSEINDESLKEKKYVKVYFNLYPEERKGRDIKWCVTNQKQTTFNNFLSNLENLVSEIDYWIAKH